MRHEGSAQDGSTAEMTESTAESVGNRTVDSVGTLTKMTEKVDTCRPLPGICYYPCNVISDNLKLHADHSLVL